MLCYNLSEALVCAHQTLKNYEVADHNVEVAALSKLSGHLWYLSGDLVGLPLFANLFPINEKKAIFVAFAGISIGEKSSAC